MRINLHFPKQVKTALGIETLNCTLLEHSERLILTVEPVADTTKNGRSSGNQLDDFWIALVKAKKKWWGGGFRGLII